ncbi:MAG: hypothetical protein GY770_07560, partial [Aestuariibacter sp.]|nr:hypothetical protein [Aestuariibacter sp.]
DSGSASAAIRIVDGVIDEATPCANWTYRGVTDNEFATNVLINDSSSEHEYAPVSGAVGTTNDTVYTDNRIYTSRSNAAIAEGWSDPERTLKSYLESLGHDVVSDDGFVEYFNLAVEMRRGAWNTELTARSIVNYFRNGFGMADIQESE